MGRHPPAGAPNLWGGRRENPQHVGDSDTVTLRNLREP